MFSRSLFVVATIAALALASTAVADTILISDTFPTDRSTGSYLKNYSPETSYAGDSWHETRNLSSGDITLISDIGNPANSALISNNSGVCSATGIGGFTNGVLHVSADIMLGSLDYTTNPTYDIFGSIGVGFYSTYDALAHPGCKNFTGLVVNSEGRVSYLQTTDASWTVGTLIGSVNWSGDTFSTDSWYTLSYDVDVATGNITNISLSGSTADYSSLCNKGELLTSTAMTYAGFYGASSVSTSEGNLDNFELKHSAVPEPSTLALLGCGLLGLLAYAWRKRK